MEELSEECVMSQATKTERQVGRTMLVSLVLSCRILQVLILGRVHSHSRVGIRQQSLRTALPAKVGGPVVVTLDVATALDFPTAGIRIEVGTEAIDCTGKNEATRQLTGCTRPGGNQPHIPLEK